VIADFSGVFARKEFRKSAFSDEVRNSSQTRDRGIEKEEI
jgi:hypothetical protein